TLVAIPLLVGSCGRHDSLPTAAAERDAFTTDSPSLALQAAVRAQERLSQRVLSIPGVVGVASSLGAGGGPLVLVYLDRPGIAGIPASFSGVKVRGEVTGP